MFHPQDPDCQACACDIQRDTAITILREVERQIVANLAVLDVLAYVRAEIARLSPPKTATVPIPLPPA
ncbi:MAG: hypothetical protein JWO08_1548 [Verrucomicrobiaceae bacterium]|nr:hypothetical protein [Verrucomicrobiaceae bacterium]